MSPRPPVSPGGRYRILFVCSSGGHLAQLLRLRPWWERHERTWVSFDTEDVRSRLADERLVLGHYPTTRNIPNLLRNLLLAVRVLRAERPDVVVTNGAGLGVPFVWVARVLGIRSVFQEVVDRVEAPTMTGRLCAPAADLMLVQWEEQRPWYRGAEVTGPLYDLGGASGGAA